MAILKVTKHLTVDIPGLLDFIFSSMDVVKYLGEDSVMTDMYLIEGDNIPVGKQRVSITCQSSTTQNFPDNSQQLFIIYKPIDGFIMHDGLYIRCWITHF